MDAPRYLSLLRADSDALVAAARRGLDADVPTCPGWTVRDLVRHVAQVYDHKVACMRELRAPDPWPPEPPAGDPLDWLVTARDGLLAELETRGPDAPSYTWYAPDQTVGFWYRRMAQETAVHRVDAELASGAHTPVADDLALDGVDEVLVVMVSGDWSDEPQPGPERAVRLRAADLTWYVLLQPDWVTVSTEPPVGYELAATVTGTPSDLLLWLWGRVPTEAVAVDGDPAGVAALRQRLVLATQ